METAAIIILYLGALSALYMAFQYKARGSIIVAMIMAFVYGFVATGLVMG